MAQTMQKEAAAERAISLLLDFWENLETIRLAFATGDGQNLDGIRRI